MGLIAPFPTHHHLHPFTSHSRFFFQIPVWPFILVAWWVHGRWWWVTFVTDAKICHTERRLPGCQLQFVQLCLIHYVVVDLYFFYFLSLFKVNSSTMVRYSRGGSMLPAVYADAHFTNDVVACFRWASSCLRMRTQALTPPSLYVVVELELSSSTRAMITSLLTQYYGYEGSSNLW